MTVGVNPVAVHKFSLDVGSIFYPGQTGRFPRQFACSRRDLAFTGSTSQSQMRSASSVMLMAFYASAATAFTPDRSSPS